MRNLSSNKKFIEQIDITEDPSVARNVHWESIYVSLRQKFPWNSERQLWWLYGQVHGLCNSNLGVLGVLRLTHMCYVTLVDIHKILFLTLSIMWLRGMSDSVSDTMLTKWQKQYTYSPVWVSGTYKITHYIF